MKNFGLAAGFALLMACGVPAAHADTVPMRTVKLTVDGLTTTLQLPATTFKNPNALEVRARKFLVTKTENIMSGDVGLEIGKGQPEQFSMTADLIAAPLNEGAFHAKGHVTFRLRQGDKIVLQISTEDATIEFGPEPTA